ncbi:ERI1 exoribonuclease 2-like isoform X2 [Lucilia sericata]|uniref:ERI1 exoribonuclease 2-like isoform X2 n=1 Tax=Lucilia sericata TaxID=13632 RepID=UPI0018A86699|nr:ERI1 exoribonuclease 2-like isoform X2 [Lucilia sericata]
MFALRFKKITPKYIIAVHFAATCWEKQPSPKFRNAEIIEFPAVLMNLETGAIEAEFHEYVKPTEKPQLSEFCIKITDIMQTTVDNAITLDSVLIKFEKWLVNELKTRQLVLPKFSPLNVEGNCAFVTWSDWDFDVCLHKECIRKNIKKPEYFNQWIKIRHLFRGSTRYMPDNFTDALRHLGLTFIGNEHSGIDYAKNMAALTHKLKNRGVALQITEDLTPNKCNDNSIFE